ncbi:hypothetical protein SCOCK_480007 [Actinacidiphila cocklensis]|uniref:Uncharacterized protein n=1 Tax=Actinacidiphila cocklensis TaxID=887465 RepID=A0A9W4DSD2_9ACTN|nr:hypothetical protein SCOCK_480007 [Actinacidiphila cocklensis]
MTRWRGAGWWRGGRMTGDRPPRRPRRRAQGRGVRSGGTGAIMGERSPKGGGKAAIWHYVPCRRDSRGVPCSRTARRFRPAGSRARTGGPRGPQGPRS